MSRHCPTPRLLCHLSPWQHHSWPQLLALWFSMSLLQSARWQVHTHRCWLMIRKEGTTLIMQKQFNWASDSTLVCFRSDINGTKCIRTWSTLAHCSSIDLLSSLLLSLSCWEVSYLSFKYRTCQQTKGVIPRILPLGNVNLFSNMQGFSQ